MKSRLFTAARSILVLALAALAPAGQQREERNLPSVGEVVSKMIDRAKQDDARHAAAGYTQMMHSVIEDLDDHGTVRARKERLYHIIYIDGEPFRRLIQRDGKPLSAEDEQREEEREKKFRETAAERKHKREQGDDDLTVNEELFNRYRIQIVQREIVNGRPALLLTFQPKSGDLPTKRRIDFLLNKMSGEVWVDEQDSEVVSGKFHLTGSANKFLGILASIKKFDATFEQTRLEDGEWFPSKFDDHIDARIVFKSLYRHDQVEWSDFRKTAPEMPKPAADPK